MESEKINLILKDGRGDYNSDYILKLTDHFLQYFAKRFGYDNLIEFKVYSKEANKPGTEKIFEMHVELFTTFGIFHAEKSEWKDTIEFREIIHVLKEQLEQLNKH